MCWFSINLNSNYSIVPGDQGVQKWDLSITFSFDRKRDLRIDGNSKCRGKLRRRILEKQADASKREKKNMSEMSSITTKALTFQTMHGWTTIKSTLRTNAKGIDKGDYRVRWWLMKRTIILDHYRDSMLFFYISLLSLSKFPFVVIILITHFHSVFFYTFYCIYSFIRVFFIFFIIRQRL